MHIEALNISHSRMDKYLFRNLNFKVRPGQLLRIQGQNGAGKTTLLKVLAGLITPDKGKITWQDQPIAQSHIFKENMALVSHKAGINPALTVKENIELQLNLAGVSSEETLFQTVLEEFGLISKANELCYQLSQGQQRKVALCALILKNKALWLLDEPYTALDQDSITAFNEKVQSHLNQQGLVIIASHQPINLSCNQVLSLC